MSISGMSAVENPSPALLKAPGEVLAGRGGVGASLLAALRRLSARTCAVVGLPRGSYGQFARDDAPELDREDCSCFILCCMLNAGFRGITAASECGFSPIPSGNPGVRFAVCWRVPATVL